MKNKSGKILEDLCGGKTVVDERSVELIREVQPNGTGLFLGDMSVPRNGWAEVEDKDDKRELGGSCQGSQRCAVEHVPFCTDIPWVQPSRQGDHVRSSRCGNQPANESMIPRLNTHKMCTRVFAGNIGSVCVLEKNELKLLETASWPWM